MINAKPSSVAIHIIGWLLFLAMPAVFIISLSNDNDANGSLINPLSWIGFSVYIFIFYLHTYFLFPKLFLKKNFAVYFFSLFILLCAVFFLRPFDRLADNRQHHGPPPIIENRPPVAVRPEFRPGEPPPDFNAESTGRRFPKVDIISIILFILVIALSITLIIERRRRIAVLLAANAQAEKANAELSFLRAQVNPHFLFNTLNNIYSLAVTKNENVADAIMKLSSIMRYVTDEAEEEYVSLQQEVDVISDYIGLQKLRLGKKVTVDYEVTGEIADKKIAPLLLMAFVENVFKYGISNAEESPVIIKIGTTDKQILFFTENRIFEYVNKKDREGVGHINTKKRLEYIYPGRHLLDIISENGLFTVQLVLNI